MFIVLGFAFDEAMAGLNFHLYSQHHNPVSLVCGIFCAAMGLGMIAWGLSR